MKIGIFDSGVGGLTVAKEIKTLLPNQPIIYFGDTARTPYGTKSKETLIGYAKEDASFLLDQGADLIVIACHSAASTAADVLKTSLDVPVFEVVTPSIEQALAVTKTKRIGLIGTRATIKSEIYKKKIGFLEPKAKVIGQPCPLLVPLIEEGWLKARETRMIVKKYLRPLKQQNIDTLVLGCTHYPLIKKIIEQKIGKRVTVVDPSLEVAKAVKQYLSDNGDIFTKKAEDKYFVSDIGPATEEIVRCFMGQKIILNKV